MNNSFSFDTREHIYYEPPPILTECKEISTAYNQGIHYFPTCIIFPFAKGLVVRAFKWGIIYPCWTTWTTTSYVIIVTSLFYALFFFQPYSCLLLTDEGAQDFEEFPPPPPELLNGNHSKQLSEASVLSEASTLKHRKTPSVESLDALPTGTDTCCQDVTDSLSNLSLLSGKCSLLRLFNSETSWCVE